MYGLCAEAARIAIADAGLTKQDINGLVTDGTNALPGAMAEYIGIRPTFATGVSMYGASGASATTAAALAISGGLCDTALVVIDDGDWDPASSTSNQALYDARPGLVDTLSVELSSVPGAYLEQTYEFDLSECSEEATMLLDTRTGAVLVVHQLQNC
jgi:hypothetical protein